MPEILKQAILKPLLKKRSLDSNVFKNYRPISNLRFISKTIEKYVAKQLIQYLDINDLGETYQSAYKRNHSTETALIRVHNDVAMAIDHHRSVILVLLDLSRRLHLILSIMVSSSRDCPIVLELPELYWNGFDHIFLIVHSLCRLMVRALLLTFLSLVYRRDPFLARCYIQCTHLLLARLLDVIKFSITFMLMTLSYILRSGRRLFLI